MAEEDLLSRLRNSSHAVLRKPADALWSTLLASDLQCLASFSHAVLLRAVPILTELLTLQARHPLLSTVLHAAVRVTATADGARAWNGTLWGARRCIKLAGCLELDDECRRLVDVAIAQTTDGASAPNASLSGRVAFEDVHRSDMYPPTRLVFHRRPAMSVRVGPACFELARVDGADGEEGVLELCLENPSRRERFGSEIPSKIWPASVILAQWLWSQPNVVRGRRVLELGAGMGLVGLAAMRCRAATVLLTDRDAKALQHMRTNIAKNSPPASHSDACVAEAAHLDWARPPGKDEDEEGGGPSTEAGRVLVEGADVVIAADIVNAPGLSELVYDMLVRFLGRAGDFLMVCPKPAHRHTVDRLRSLLLESEHFDCTVDDVPTSLVAAARTVAASAGDMEPAEFDVVFYEMYHARWKRDAP